MLKSSKATRLGKISATMSGGKELVGTWIHRYQGMSSETNTTLELMADGTYKKTIETTAEMASSWGPVEDTYEDIEEGQWEVSALRQVRLTPLKAGKRACTGHWGNDVLRLGSQVFSREDR